MPGAPCRTVGWRDRTPTKAPLRGIRKGGARRCRNERPCPTPRARRCNAASKLGCHASRGGAGRAFRSTRSAPHHPARARPQTSERRHGTARSTRRNEDTDESWPTTNAHPLARSGEILHRRSGPWNRELGIGGRAERHSLTACLARKNDPGRRDRRPGVRRSGYAGQGSPAKVLQLLTLPLSKPARNHFTRWADVP